MAKKDIKLTKAKTVAKHLPRQTFEVFTTPYAEKEITLILRDALQQTSPRIYQALLSGESRDTMIKMITEVVDRASGFAATYTDTGLSVIGRERIAKSAEDLGLVWYRYIGGEIETSRDFCIERDGGFYHESEIEEWADEEWGGKIDGTNSENIYSFLGGWNCRHDLIPVLEESVPEEYVKAFERSQETEEEEEIPSENITREPDTEIVPMSQEELDELYNNSLKPSLESKYRVPVDKTYVDAGADLGLTQNDVTVINYYTGDAYSKINAFNRGGLQDNKFYGAYTEHLNQSLGRLPSENYKQLYRWESFNEDRWKLYTSNKDVQFNSFYSTAQTKSSTYFDGGFDREKQKLRVYVEPKVSGSKGKSISELSNMSEEYEVLFSTKSRFKVVKHSLETKELWLQEL